MMPGDAPLDSMKRFYEAMKFPRRRGMILRVHAMISGCREMPPRCHEMTPTMPGNEATMLGRFHDATTGRHEVVE